MVQGAIEEGKNTFRALRGTDLAKQVDQIFNLLQ